MTSKQLEQILLKAKPFEPRALVLLRKHQAGEVKSITQIDRMRAFTEMDTNRKFASAISSKLLKLSPEPISIAENEFVQGFYL